MRTRLPPLTACPMRDGPQLGQTIITLEMAMADSCSAIPPLILRCWLGRTFFFTIFTCSTRTLPVLGETRSTRPCLPASPPAITFTVSLRLMSTLLCIINLHQSAASDQSALDRFLLERFSYRTSG